VTPSPDFLRTPRGWPLAGELRAVAKAQFRPPHEAAGKVVGPEFGPVQAYLFDLEVLAGASELEQREMERERRKAAGINF
jgi:hypothetical protein